MNFWPNQYLDMAAIVDGGYKIKAGSQSTVPFQGRVRSLLFELVHIQTTWQGRKDMCEILKNPHHECCNASDSWSLALGLLEGEKSCFSHE